MLSLIVVFIALAIVVIFSVQNAAPVAISFLFWRFEASLVIVVFLSLLIGVLCGMVVMSWLRMRRSAREKKAAKQDERTQ